MNEDVCVAAPMIPAVRIWRRLTDAASCCDYEVDPATAAYRLAAALGHALRAGMLPIKTVYIAITDVPVALMSPTVAELVARADSYYQTAEDIIQHVPTADRDDPEVSAVVNRNWDEMDDVQVASVVMLNVWRWPLSPDWLHTMTIRRQRIARYIAAWQLAAAAAAEVAEPLNDAPGRSGLPAMWATLVPHRAMAAYVKRPRCPSDVLAAWHAGAAAGSLPY